MHIAYLVVTIVTIAATAASAVTDFARADFVLANSAEVGVPRSVLPWLATLKAAGAAGLLAGLLGMEVLGLAAAVCLVLFFAGAITVHIRARVFYNLGFAGSYFALALVTAALTAAQ